MSGLQIQTTQNTPKNPSSKSSSNPHRFGDIKANVLQLLIVAAFLSFRVKEPLGTLATTLILLGISSKNLLLNLDNIFPSKKTSELLVQKAKVRLAKGWEWGVLV